MTYENLITEGILTEVSQPTLVERSSTPELVFPESVFLTRVRIAQANRASSIEIFGVIPLDYVGKDVRLVESYNRLPNGKLFMQELYLDGRRFVNQAVVRTM